MAFAQDAHPRFSVPAAPPTERLVLLPRLGQGLLEAALFTIPLNVYVLLGPAGGRVRYGSLFLFEIFAFAALPFHVSAVRRCKEMLPRSIYWTFVAAMCWVVLSAVVNPTLEGALRIFGLITASSLAVVVVGVWSRAPRLILVPFVSGCLLQVLLSVLQWERQGAVGWHLFGEGTRFIPFGDVVAVQGTFPHPYVLAGYSTVVLGATVLFVASRSRCWTGVAAAALVVFPLGLTFARMNVLALLALFLPLAVAASRDERLRSLLAAIFISACLAFSVGVAGWTRQAGKSAESITSGTGQTRVDSFTSGRLTFMRQAVEVIQDHPWVGSGPSLYLHELEQNGHADQGQELYPVHMVPLLVAAESGLPAGILFSLLLALLGWKALRASPGVLAVFLSYVPFLLLDHFPYSQRQGLASTAIWAGVLLAVIFRDSPKSALSG